MKDLKQFITESVAEDAIEILAYKKHYTFWDIMDAFRKVVSEEDAEDFAFDAAAWVRTDKDREDYDDVYDFIEEIYDDALKYEDDPGPAFARDLAGMLDSKSYEKIYNELK